mmetsp:Transcript_48878/g.121264  ORF Transcript_48878/g.121264 Transcript_48878/m.121264 type:complete len:647 (-) Transcript_48878:459-2399(-)
MPPQCAPIEKREGGNQLSQSSVIEHSPMSNDERGNSCAVFDSFCSLGSWRESMSSNMQSERLDLLEDIFSELSVGRMSEAERGQMRDCLVAALEYSEETEGDANPSASLMQSLQLCLESCLGAGRSVDASVLTNTEPRDAALQILVCLTGNEHFRERTTAEEANRLLAPLIARLHTAEDAAVLGQLMTVVDHFTSTPLTCDVVVALGGIPALLSALQRAQHSIPFCQRAAHALCNIGLCAEHEQRIIGAGGVEALVRLLQVDDEQLVDVCLDTIANLMSSDSVCGRVVRAGGVQVIGALVRHSAKFSMRSGWVLSSLAVDKLSHEQLVLDGALDFILLHARKEPSSAKEEAAWALANLVSSTKVAKLVLAYKGALATVFTLAMSTDMKVRLQAIWTIANLSSPEELKVTMGQQGALRVLEETLAPSISAEAHECTKQAVRAISNLLMTASNRTLVLAHHPRLVGQLLLLVSSQPPAIVGLAARALENVCRDVDIARLLFQEAGIVTLIGMCRSEEQQEQLSGTSIIGQLSDIPDFTEALVEPQVLSTLVGLLKSSHPSVKEQAAKTLVKLSSTNESKVAIINAGALDSIEDVYDLKDFPRCQAAFNNLLLSVCEVLTPRSRQVFVNDRLRGARFRRPDVDAATSEE